MNYLNTKIFGVFILCSNLLFYSLLLLFACVLFTVKFIWLGHYVRVIFWTRMSDRFPGSWSDA